MRMKSALGIVLVVLAAVLLGGYFLVADEGFARKPKEYVRWEQPELTITLAPGESKTATTSFTVLRAIRHARVTIPSSLTPYVSVNPSDLRKKRKGAHVTVTVNVAAPASADFARLEGEIGLDQFRWHRKPKGVLLPLHLTVAVGTPYADQRVGFRIVAPPSFRVVPQEEGSELSTFGILGPTTQSIGLSVAHNNPKGLTVEEWADTRDWAFEGSWKEKFTVVSIDGTTFLRDFPTCSAIAVKGEWTFTFTDEGGYEPCTMDQQTFDLILASLQFTK